MTHFVHDRMGNVIAEADGSGTTQREYVWLLETQTAATRQAYAQVDRPVAVVAGGVTYKVHVDHLNRPVMMTNAAKAAVWDAVWLPWGGVYSVTGSLTLDARFPGQWFQLESGLHYNWHRHYDPSIGRYTQPDPLGFVDGPSVFGYARGNPQSFVDPDGRLIVHGGPTGAGISGGGAAGGAGIGLDLWTGKPGGYASGGWGVGLAWGAGWNAGIFFGDWCDFSGPAYNINLSVLGWGGTVTVTPKLRFGISGGWTRGVAAVPAGVSVTRTRTLVTSTQDCGCGGGGR